MSDNDFAQTRQPNRPIVTFKDSVQFSTACLPIFGELAAAAIDTMPATFDNAVHFTSADDGIHSPTSWHYVGMGFDIRTLGVRHGGIKVDGIDVDAGDERLYMQRQYELAKWWADRLQRRLSGRWQIICEDDHLHCEKDPS